MPSTTTRTLSAIDRFLQAAMGEKPEQDVQAMDLRKSHPANELLRKHGVGDEIKGHPDGYATACPGDALYTRLRKGAPRPGGTQPANPSAKQYEPYPGATFFMKGSRPALGKS
ncbi:hypothetical protein [Streptomyces sp. NPDC050164]|uniref:hypothetical protein n=1 Tax=Streptomyces sp. NPDC050164 TaxID=3365605 RepID=UPI0037B78EBF